MVYYVSRLLTRSEKEPLIAVDENMSAALQAQAHPRDDLSNAMDILITTMVVTAVVALVVERVIMNYWSSWHTSGARGAPQAPQVPASPRPSTSLKRERDSDGDVPLRRTATRPMEVDEAYIGDSVSALEIEKKDLQEQRAKLNARCQNLMLEVTGLRRELRAAQIKENQLKDQVGALKEKVIQLEHTILDAEQTVEHDVNTWRDLEDQLRTEIGRLNMELNTARAAIISDEQLANDAAVAAQNIVQRARQAAADEPPYGSVMITPQGGRWHRETCVHARGGRLYTPCRACNPDRVG